jgi:CO/xanthine dehydrogenase Mo-binding subunit
MSVGRGPRGTGRFPGQHRPLKEGGPRGKHGFPRGSEPEASDAHAATLCRRRARLCVYSCPLSEVVGTRVTRQDALEKATGGAHYLADLVRPGLLHGKLLLAGLPHARISRLDVSAARALPGVLAVLTQDDVPDVHYGPLVRDRTLFARDVVRFEGEVVAAVAAVTVEVAADACRLIRVEYEPLEPVLDPEAALREGAPCIHPRWEEYDAAPSVLRGGNGCGFMTQVKGDVERGLADADLVVSERYETDMTHAVPIEPHGALAEWSGRRVTVWSSTQAPFAARSGIARTLELPESDVRVIVPTLGGGFGGKCDFHFEAHAAALARAAGRPVRLLLDRREEFTAIDKTRHPIAIELETGVSADGSFTARRARIVLDAGAYVSDSLYATELALMLSVGPYRIPNVSAEAHTVYTNRTPAGSVRAPAGPQLCWAVEQHTDVIAERLGLDALELRRRNLVRPGDTGPTGQSFARPAALECLERAAELAGWGKELPDGEALGIGCGWWFSHPAPSGAYMKLNADGSGTIVTGAQENGSGAVMGLALLAADELGLRPDELTILCQDTDAGAYDIGSQGSQTTINNGRAVLAAAREVREQLLALASDELEIAPDDLELAGGMVRAKGAPARAVSIPDLAAKAHGGELLLGRGSGSPPPIPEHDTSGCAGRGAFSAFGSPSFACHVAHVRVDRETGVARVLGYVAVHDFGRVLNPVGAEGQVEGGVVHGLGIALSEGTVNRDGRQLNPHLLDYKLQTAADSPPIIVAFVESDPGEGTPLGGKGVGEPPVIPPAAAVGNALARAAGGRVRRLPMTPERVWEVLHG